MLKIPTLFILVFLAHTLLAKDFDFYNDGDSVKVKKERIFEVFNTYGLNSEYSEISPIFYNKELVFCSNREWNKNTFGESDWHETKH